MKSRGRILAWPGVLAAGAVLVIHARVYDFVADDTFIGLRYARNLIEGHGLTYNPGEHVEGYTNLLWILTLGGMGAAGLDLLVASRILALTCALGSMVVAASIARRLSPSDESWIGPAAAGLVALSAPMACWSLSGMETTAYALGAASSGWLALRAEGRTGRLFLVGLVAGATVLIRPEGVLLGPTLAALELAIRRGTGGIRRSFALAAPFAVIVAAQVGWRLHYYGDWLPNTFYAKVGGGSLALAARGGEYLFDYARDCGGFLAVFLLVVGAAWRRDAPWWTIAALLVSQTAAVVLVGGDGLPMYRFVVPLVPLGAALASVSVAEVIRRHAMSRSRQRVVFAALGLVGILTLIPPTWSDAYRMYWSQKEYEVPDWTAAGEWLHDHARSGDSVACVPIGAVGFASGLVVVDMLGLTDRHIAKLAIPTGHGWAGHEKHDGPYVLSREPTYLLLGNVHVADAPLVLDDPGFVRGTNASIEARESDIFVPELLEEYVPAVVQLSNGRYLHFLQRRRP